jgi:hypothetical protein
MTQAVLASHQRVQQASTLLANFPQEHGPSQVQLALPLVAHVDFPLMARPCSSAAPRRSRDRGGRREGRDTRDRARACRHP